MSGRWLLDAAALYSASRRVLSKHIALRNYQYENYDKTSSLIRAIRSQTDRVTLTVKAAANLAARFNGPDAHYPNSAQKSFLNAAAFSKDSVAASRADLPTNESIEQDHYYNRPERNDTKQPVPTDVRQEKGNTRPLPDGSIKSVSRREEQSANENNVSLNGRKLVGPLPTVATKAESAELGGDFKLNGNGNMKTDFSRSDDGELLLSSIQARQLQCESEAPIPSEAAEPPPLESADQDSKIPALAEIGVEQEKDVYYTPPSVSTPVLSSLPRVKVPKVTENTQENDEHVSDIGLNQDVYYKSTAADFPSRTTTSQADAEPDPISEEMYSEIFHSPKVARILGGGQKRKQEPDITNSSNPIHPLPRDYRDVQGKEMQAPSRSTVSNESFLTTAQPKIAGGSKISPSENTIDPEQLAADIAEDVKRGSANGEEVLLTLQQSLEFY